MNPMHMKSAEERREIALKSAATREKNRYDRAMARKALRDKKDDLMLEVMILENRLKEMKTMVTMTQIAAGLTGGTLLREEEIVQAAAPWQDATGVYFLVKERKVIYVGQSVNIYSRISGHHHKGFDSYAFIPCCAALLDKVESLYIHMLRPPLNGHRYDGTKAAPLRLEELLKMEGIMPSDKIPLPNIKHSG